MFNCNQQCHSPHGLSRVWLESEDLRRVPAGPEVAQADVGVIGHLGHQRVVLQCRADLVVIRNILNIVQ